MLNKEGMPQIIRLFQKSDVGVFYVNIRSQLAFVGSFQRLCYFLLLNNKSPTC